MSSLSTSFHKPAWKIGPQFNAMERFVGWTLDHAGRHGRKRPRFDPNEMMRLARRLTGLSDFGNPRFEVPFRIRCTYYETQAPHTSLGRVITYGMLLRTLANRLRIQAYLKRQPDVLDLSIKKPVFIVALPRTGTTLLLNLLTQDPAARPLLNWEATDPVPPRPIKPRHRDPRIRKAERIAARLNRLLPGMSVVHPIDPRGPEECVALLANASLMPAQDPRDREYRRWLETVSREDVLASYREYRAQLQILQWQFMNGYWLLKSPLHMFGLDALLELFPDAWIIQTHRDMAEVVPSTCSLGATLHSLIYDDLDPIRAGQYGIEHLDLMVRRAEHARAEHKNARLLDVSYTDLTRDPEGTVRDLYKKMDKPFSPLMKSRIRCLLQPKRKKGPGKHRYQPQDFGLTASEIRTHFRSYGEKYGLPTH